MNIANDKIFNYIDEIYEIIYKCNYNYKISMPILVSLKEEILIESFEKNAYYYQLMATIEYFIHLSQTTETPYKNLLPKDNQINSYFKTSLNLDKDNPPLRYLFALYLYNTGAFTNAKEQFSKIDFQYFKDLDVLDRVFKIRELILCCTIFLDEVNEDDIIIFLKELETLEVDMYPADLITTLDCSPKYDTDKIKFEINNFITTHNK